MRGERSLDLLDPDLLPFQKRFIKALESGRYDECVLSLPRGGGKSALSAHLLVRCLTPGDRLNVPGAEYIMCAASLQQARLLVSARQLPGEDGSRAPTSTRPFSRRRLSPAVAGRGWKRL